MASAVSTNGSLRHSLKRQVTMRMSAIEKRVANVASLRAAEAARTSGRMRLNKERNIADGSINVMRHLPFLSFTIESGGVDSHA